MRTGSDTISPGPQWSEAAKAELARRGHRSGGARTAVIDALAEGGGCIEAERLEERLRERGSTVGTASVYRALGLLTEIGMLQRVAVAGAPVRYELVHPDGHHHHHIVCDRCGRTVAFTDDALEKAVHDVSRRAAFDVRAHEITLHGVCDDCA